MAANVHLGLTLVCTVTTRGGMCFSLAALFFGGRVNQSINIVDPVACGEQSVINIIQNWQASVTDSHRVEQQVKEVQAYYSAWVGIHRRARLFSQVELFLASSQSFKGLRDSESQNLVSTM